MTGTRVELPAYSMFTTTPIYRVGGTLVFGLLDTTVGPDASDDLVLVTSGNANRLDLLSAGLYGTAHLWWVLASVNGIHDPLVGPVTGDTIRVPTKSRLVSLGVLTA